MVANHFANNFIKDPLGLVDLKIEFLKKESSRSTIYFSKVVVPISKAESSQVIHERVKQKVYPPFIRI